MTLYWYIILDEKELPTPYASIEQVDEAMDELKSRLGPCCISCILH